MGDRALNLSVLFSPKTAETDRPTPPPILGGLVIAGDTLSLASQTPNDHRNDLDFKRIRSGGAYHFVGMRTSDGAVERTWRFVEPPLRRAIAEGDPRITNALHAVKFSALIVKNNPAFWDCPPAVTIKPTSYLG